MIQHDICKPSNYKQDSKKLTWTSVLELDSCSRFPKNIVPRFCGYCGGAVHSITPIFTQLHRSGFNLKFETLFESIWQVVADLWQRKGKISSSFKNSTSVVLHQYQNQVNFKERTLAS